MGEHFVSIEDFIPPELYGLAEHAYAPQESEWNGNLVSIVHYRVMLREEGYLRMESYIFYTPPVVGVSFPQPIKITGVKTSFSLLEIPFVGFYDLDKDGREEMVYVYSMEEKGSLIVEVAVFSDDSASIKDGQLKYRDDLTMALRGFDKFNYLSGSEGGKALKLSEDEIKTVINAFCENN